MECGHCYFAHDGRAEDKWCLSCGRSYRPAVNVYLGLVTLVYLVLIRYVNYCLSGNFLRMGDKPSWIMFHWARWPVDIQQRPEFILVLGGFLAVMVLVPVVVAILYGKRGGALLATVALVIGPSWLVGALLFGCIWIAGDWRLRLSSKVGSALLACAPIWLFYLIASVPREDVALSGAYYIPALVSILMAIVLIFLLLVPLRILRWNARVAGIALSLLCILPIWTYKLWVGEDEIHYALLSRDVGLASGLFVDIPGEIVRKEIQELVGSEIEAEEADKVLRSGKLQLAGLPVEELDKLARTNRMKINFKLQLKVRINAQKEEVRQRCEEFRKGYPGSRHLADVYYTEARALDMDLDLRSFYDPLATSLPIRFSADRIVHNDNDKDRDKDKSSLAIWKRLRDGFADGPYAAEAAVKLAAHLARTGKLDEANAAYEEFFKTYRDEVNQPLPDTSNLSVFTDLLVVGKRLRARTRAERIEQQYQIARKEHAFLVENRQASGAHDAVLADYLGLGRFLPDENKRTELARLLKSCESCPLADNLAYELAALAPKEVRREKMLKVSNDYKGTDGAALALLALAELAAHDEGDRRQGLQQAIDYCKELLIQYGKSYLARAAERKKHQYERALDSIEPQQNNPANGEQR